MGIFTENEGKSQKIGGSQTLIDAISVLIADFLRLIDVNAGVLGQKKGPGNFTHKESYISNWATNYRHCVILGPGIKH